MRAILHILTRAEDGMAREIIAKQRAMAEARVEVVELTNGEPDYDALVEKIFAADSVEVW